MKIIADVPPIVVTFLRKHISSVWQLELILFIRSGKKPLSLAEISAGLYMSADSLATALTDFERSGLIEHQPNGYVYAPATSALRDAVDQTAKVYSERRVAVINLIFSTPLKSLSDAFKLKSEE